MLRPSPFQMRRRGREGERERETHLSVCVPTRARANWGNFVHFGARIKSVVARQTRSSVTPSVNSPTATDDLSICCGGGGARNVTGFCIKCSGGSFCHSNMSTCFISPRRRHSTKILGKEPHVMKRKLKHSETNFTQQFSTSS